MADKFLSRPDSKQRILRLDLAPVGEKAALVVTAELERLTYFCSDQFGVWRFVTRAHDALATVGVGPDETLGFAWSRRNGVAAREGLGAVLFKRSIEGNVALFIDLLRLGEDGLQLVTDQAIAVPLAARTGLVGVGLDVWARMNSDYLLVVTQGWFREQFGILRPPEPHLILLKCPIKLLTPEGVADPQSWSVHLLDKGGFDLDARLESDRVWVVHRHSGAATSLEASYVGNEPTIVPIMDEPSNQFDWDLGDFVGDMPRIQLVSCEIATGQASVVHADIPSVERPQLHRIDPVIITGDRITDVRIRTEVIDDDRHFTVEDISSEKWVIWRFRDRWVTDSIADPRHRRWPLNLEEIAASQYMMDFQNERMSFATRASLKPIVLADFRVTEKGREIAFIIEHSTGAVVTDFYRFVPNEVPGEGLDWFGRNVLDVGHESISPIAGGEGNETLHPAEHSQFLPFVIDVETNRLNRRVFHFQLGGQQRFLATRNTLGGLLVGDQDLGVGLLAYVGMDDGGGRVVFAPGVEPLPPTTTQSYKSLPPQVLVDPLGGGRAWVELLAADWINAQLPGYFVPYNDVLRRSPAPGILLLLFAVIESLLQHFTPRSIGSGMQLQIDALPFAAALTAGSGVGIDDIRPTNIEIDRAAADDIQATIAAQAGASQPIANDGQPFPCSFTFTPGLAQANMTLTFVATAAPPGGGATFEWSFTPPDDEDLSIFDNPVNLSGASVAMFFIIDGRWTVDLVATASDGTTSTVTGQIDVAPRLWNQIWEPDTNISNDQIRVGSVTLSISKFVINYIREADGGRSRVSIDYLSEHVELLRFLPGEAGQQGRIALRMPLSISSTQASFRGLLGTVLKLNNLNATFFYERRFTPSVVTSDRRSFDVGAGQTYVDLDRQADLDSTPRESDVETIRHFAFAGDHLTDTNPNAIAARPVDEGEVTLDSVTLDTELSDGVGALATIAGVIIALSLLGSVLMPIMMLLAIAMGPLAPIAILIGAGLLLLVSIAISLGIGALLRPIFRAILTDFATGIARTEMSRPEVLTELRAGLDAGQVMTYAGEGVAEAIAIAAVRQAILDGHGVIAPAHDLPDPSNPGQNLPATGRERSRDQFFETIAVGDGVCRVLLRVP